jgi:hypothetical protein
MAGPLCAQERPSVRTGPRHECSVKVVASPRNQVRRYPKGLAGALIPALMFPIAPVEALWKQEGTSF